MIRLLLGKTEGSNPAITPFSLLLVFLAGLSLVRIVILSLGLVELSQDEAHYWEWSRRLDWCYYSKPPGVATMIWLGTQLFGDTVLGVRCFAVLLSFLASLAIYGLGSRLINPQTGAWAAILLQLIPIFSSFGLGITPDSPLIFFWSASLYFFHRCWTVGKLRDWAILAVMIGLGLLCKYAIVYFYVPMWILLLGTRQGRQHLRSVGPYLCVLGSLLFFTPVVWWNSQNDWVMFRHDLGHAGANEPFAFNPAHLFNGYIGVQLAVITPITAAYMLWLTARGLKRDPFSFWFMMPILLAFLIKSLQSKIQANWPMVAWLAGLVPLAAYIVSHYTGLNKVKRGWLRATIVVPAIGAMILHSVFLLEAIPWPNRINPIKKLIGHEELARKVDQIRTQLSVDHFVFSDRYYFASSLAFYLPDHPITYNVNLGQRRMNQYDLWEDFTGRIGDDAVFVSKRARFPEPLSGSFEKVEPEKLEIHDRFGRVIHTYHAYRCYNFKGYEVPIITKF